MQADMIRHPLPAISLDGLPLGSSNFTRQEQLLVCGWLTAQQMVTCFDEFVDAPAMGMDHRAADRWLSVDAKQKRRDVYHMCYKRKGLGPRASKRGGGKGSCRPRVVGVLSPFLGLRCVLSQIAMVHERDVPKAVRRRSRDKRRRQEVHESTRIESQEGQLQHKEFAAALPRLEPLSGRTGTVPG